MLSLIKGEILLTLRRITLLNETGITASEWVMFS